MRRTIVWMRVAGLLAGSFLAAGVDAGGAVARGPCRDRPVTDAVGSAPNPPGSGHHISYFGLTGACERAEHIPEVAPFTNLCTIGLDDPRLLAGRGGTPPESGAGIRRRIHERFRRGSRNGVGDGGPRMTSSAAPATSPFLEELEDRGLELILSLHEVFFQTEGEGRGALHPDHERRWRRAIAGREHAIREAGAVALLADEPHFNRIAPADVNRVHRVVDGTFPHLITAVSLSSPGVAYWLGGDTYEPDAISYHHYRILDPNAPGDAYMAAMDTIRHLLPDRPLFIVMDAWSSPAHLALGITPEVMGEVARRYRRRCEQEPNCIGMVGFTWVSRGYVTGLRDLPVDVQRTYHRIGSEITGKPLVPDFIRPQHALMLEGGVMASLEVVTPAGVLRGVARPAGVESGRFSLDAVVAAVTVEIEDGSVDRVLPAFTTRHPASLRIYEPGSDEPVRTLYWGGAAYAERGPPDAGPR